MIGSITSVHHQGKTYPNLHNALIAGLVGGVFGTGLKTLCELISPPRPPGQPSPLRRGIGIIFAAIAGHEMSESGLYIAELIVHWVFGTGTGIAYSLIAEKTELVTIGYGLGFGVTFWLLIHEMLLRLMGWSAWPAGMSFHEQGNEFVSQCFYGVSVEVTRRALRKRMGS